MKKPSVKLCMVFGINFLIMGTILIISRNVLYEYCKYMILNLGPNSMMYDKWVTNPYPINLDFYIFNWTNPKEIFDSNIKPNFTEIGPYSFNEIKEKVNIAWNDNNTVSFNMKKTWYYNETKNDLNLSENITTINLINIIATYQSRYSRFYISKPISIFISTYSQKVEVIKTADELLFSGYYDVLLSIGNRLPGSLPKQEKFSLFYGRNNSAPYDGYYNMDRNYENNGDVLKWNFNEKAVVYNKSCNIIKSSVGDLFRPNRRKTDQLAFFFSDACRPLLFDYAGEVDINGLLGYKYILGDRLFDNGTKIQGNECYCNGECSPYGVINITSCKFDVPIFVSLPHFYKADPYYTNLVEGMHPNKDKHEFYLVLEPVTGIVLETSARLQINVLVQSFPHVMLYQNMPKVFMPFLWFEQKFRLPDEMVFNIKMFLELPKIFLLIGIIFNVIGIILLILSSQRLQQKAAAVKANKN